MLDLPEPSGPEDTGDIFAPVGVYQLPSKVAAVSDHENYAFRGKHLSHLSLYQWRSIVLVKEKKTYAGEEKQSKICGRRIGRISKRSRIAKRTVG